MSGFLIKDFRLLMRQGRYFGMVMLFLCAISFLGSKNYSSFVTSYLTFMITMFSFSSFSYDEYDSGMAFLVSLPHGRRNYVKAKYLFSILIIFGGWVLACLLHIGLFLVRFSLAEYLEVLPQEPVYLILCLSYISFAFPVVMKYGSEKGRNMSFLLLAVVCFSVYLLIRSNIQLPALMMLGRTLENAPGLFWFLLSAVCILFLFLSYLISVRIMRKKEF